MNILDNINENINPCDGSLTLGENIADYGGLKIAYYACKNNLKSDIYNEKMGT